MCRYLSGIVFKTGELQTSEYTDSHEALIKWLDLDDSAPIETRTWIRVEFTPNESKDFGDVKKYILKVDESSTPIWFDDEMRDHIAEEMTEIVKSCIIKSNKKFLLGGKWILVGDAKIDSVQNATIVCMLETSQVGVMWGTSQVGEMWVTSQVGEMRETSQVGVMWGTSQVGEMRGTSQVGEMLETSQVGVMWGTSQVGVMWGTSKVGVMWETSQVGEMWETSKVEKDNRIK